MSAHCLVPCRNYTKSGGIVKTENKKVEIQLFLACRVLTSIIL